MSATAYRTQTCGDLRPEHEGNTATIAGWVHRRRDHGGIIFIDLRDAYGLTQITVHPEETEAFQAANTVSREDVIQVSGIVEKRPPEMMNTKLATGKIEVHVKTFTLLSKAATPPFDVSSDERVDEDVRLRYRYLDLRREKMQKNLRFRHAIVKHAHDFFSQEGFREVHTPILTSSSPEGARDYLVPSRLHPGKFFALPQAPQQFKQLLMVAGVDKYYQIAPCFRDEDPRADRLPGEFYQLDLEMSFVDEEDVQKMVERYLTEVTERLAKKTILKKPFPKMTYKEAMETYGSDKPDIRYNMHIVPVTDILRTTECAVFKNALKEKNGVVHLLRVENGATLLARKDIDELTDAAKQQGAGGLAYIQCKNDGSITSPLWKYLNETEQRDLLAEALRANPERPVESSGDILFFGAGPWMTVCKALGAVRMATAKMINERLPEKERFLDPEVIAWLWITDFPMYEYNEQEKKIDFMHNPFSMPKGGLRALDANDPLTINAHQYDIVANGFEIASGAIRNHRPEIMERVFAIAGYDKKTLEEKFGHMLKAFSFGVPPHGGIATGIERFIMILSNEENVREVFPFPKNGRGEDVMMNAPSTVTEQQLRDIHIAVNKNITKKTERKKQPR